MPKRTLNPKSLQNLEARGRTPDWDEPKKRRYLFVTDPGFDGSLKVARSLGCNSVSDFLDKVGRGVLVFSVPAAKEPSCDERVKEAIAYLVPRIAIRDRAVSIRAFKKLVAKLAE